MSVDGAPGSWFPFLKSLDPEFFRPVLDMHRFLPIILGFFVPAALFSSASGEEGRIQKAVETVSPRLVRIDTIGGHEKVGKEFANEGTSTGILLDRDGHVLTSAFNFLHDPTSILLRFSNGTKKVARKIATDSNRMMTLLKVEDLNADFIPEKPDFRSKDSVRPGERCLVLGVALAQDEPNLAHGIISGKDRIWGKAIQTDAAVGPNNYGGPLIDLDGKLIGIAVPLSMMSNELSAGTETYDAGVGMAVPMDDIMNVVLAKLKEGKDLEPGTLGFGFKDNRTFIGPAVLDLVLPDLPAVQAGLKPGDEIVSVDETPVASALELEKNLRPRYAGETVRLVYRRDDAEQSVSLTTVPIPKKPESKKTEE